MKIQHYIDDDDAYFDEYADSVKYDLLKERLLWQHHACKEIHQEYKVNDEDCDFD
ncbi:hypothetical protein SAMN06295945_1050 [Polynucleobacter meluiroseus]|uniref:Uncharacterized protein n=2 Tax=Polynucleobacter meluiroseus TaxID=1938814 RepID=A0A240DZU1_9BURK|nr:hypothetical protein SAMN06295945_1050 [Polynucleobacter meluiroseus]